MGFAAGKIIWCGIISVWGGVMSVLNSVEAFRKGALFRKQVSISRDGEDFVVAYQPDNNRLPARRGKRTKGGYAGSCDGRS